MKTRGIELYNFGTGVGYRKVLCRPNKGKTILNFNLLMIEKFKLINPKGKVYLKLDMIIHWLNRLAFDQYTINLLKEHYIIKY